MSRLTTKNPTGIFATLPVGEQRIFESIAKRVVVAPGELIIARGGTDTELYIIIEGLAQVIRRHKSGKEIVVSHLKSGDLIGELSFITQAPRSADVRAQTSCQLRKINRMAFEKVRRKTPEFVFNLLKLVSLRLAESTQQFAQATLLDVPTRLLLRLNTIAAGRTGRGREDPRAYFEVPSQSELARDLGVARESVNRAMRELEENGEVERDGRRMRIIQR